MGFTIGLLSFKHYSPAVPEANAVSKIDSVPCSLTISSQIDCPVQFELSIENPAGNVIGVPKITSLTTPPPFVCVHGVTGTNSGDLSCGQPSLPTVHTVTLDYLSTCAPGVYPQKSTLALNFINIAGTAMPSTRCGATNTHVVFSPGTLSCCTAGHEIYYNGGQFIVSQLCP